MPGKNTAQRGPAADVLAKIASMLGIDAEKLQEDPWCIADAVYALQDASKVEQILDAASGAPTEPAPAGDAVEAEARALIRAVIRGAKRGEERMVTAQLYAPSAVFTAAERSQVLSLALRQAAKRQVEGVEPDQVDAMLGSLIELGREVLGKPDAAPADVLAELVARKDEIAASLGSDAPPAEEPPETEAAGEERAEGDKPTAEALDEEGDKGGEKERPAPDALEALRAREAEAVAAVAKLREDLAAEREKTRRFETREWLEAEIGKRSLAIPTAEREKLLTLTLEKGRDVAEMILDARNRPPVTNPLDGQRDPCAKRGPATYREAVDDCMSDARALLKPGTPDQVVRARAQKLAAERYPDVSTERQSDD